MIGLEYLLPVGRVITHPPKDRCAAEVTDARSGKTRGCRHRARPDSYTCVQHEHLERFARMSCYRRLVVDG